LDRSLSRGTLTELMPFYATLRMENVVPIRVALGSRAT